MINITNATYPMRGIDLMSALNRIRSSGMREIRRNTRKILSNRATKMSSDSSIGIKLAVTMTKSNRFHPLLKKSSRRFSAASLMLIANKKMP